MVSNNFNTLNKMALESIMPVAPTGYGGGFGGIAPVGLIGLNSLLGGVAGAVPVQNHVIEQTLGEIRKDIGDAKAESIKTECNIQAAIQVQDASNQVNFRHLDKQICDTEKTSIIFAKDALIEGLRTEARSADRLTAFERATDTNFDTVNKGISDTNTNLEKVNTHLTHLIDSTTCKLEFQAEKNKGELALQIERGFCNSREEALKDELDRLRRGTDLANQNLFFSNQVNALNSIVADLSQQQKMTNQTIQFGTGNLAGTSSTNNQVR